MRTRYDIYHVVCSSIYATTTHYYKDINITIIEIMNYNLIYTSGALKLIGIKDGSGYAVKVQWDGETQEVLRVASSNINEAIDVVLEQIGFYLTA